MLAFEVCEEFISKVLARIVETQLSIKPINLFDIGVFELKGNVEVLSDSLRRLGLWNDGTAMGYTPD